MRTYEEQATKFLSSKDNLGLALEVARLLPQVKERLQTSFWKTLSDRIAKRLLDFSNGWTVTNIRIEQEMRIRIKPTTGKRHCCVDIGADEGRLYYGVYMDGVSERPPPGLISGLRETLQNVCGKGELTPEDEGEGWVEWWQLNIKIAWDDACYLSVAEESSPLIEDSVAVICERFERVRKDVEEINKALAAG